MPITSPTSIPTTTAEMTEKAVLMLNTNLLTNKPMVIDFNGKCYMYVTLIVTFVQATLIPTLVSFTMKAQKSTDHALLP